MLNAARAMALTLFLAGCVSSPVAGNDGVAAAFRDHRSGIQVTAAGTVARVLADQPGPSGAHQRIILRLAQGDQTLLVENNLAIGKRVPANPGDAITVHGEYVWNREGGIVHFTHHDPARTHEGGWIERDGVRYE